MAEEQIIIDVKINAEEMQKQLSKSLQDLKEYKDAQSELQKQIKEGKPLTDEQAKAYANNAKQIEILTRNVKSQTSALQYANKTTIEQNMSLDEQRAALNALQKAYAGLSGSAKKAADAEGGLRDQIGQLSKSIKSQEGSMGDFRRNVGNYGSVFDKIGSSVGNLPGPFKAASGGVKMLGTSLKGLMANPYVAAVAVVLGAIVLACKGVKAAAEEMADAFKRDEDAMEGLTEATAPLKAMTQDIDRMFDSLVDELMKLDDWVKSITGDLGLFDMMVRVLLGPLMELKLAVDLVVAVFKSYAKWIEILVNKYDGLTNGAISAFIGKIGEMYEALRKNREEIGKIYEMLKNSSLAKALGLDKVIEDLQIIGGFETEITEQNKEIAAEELRISKQRRANMKADADDQVEIIRLKNEFIKAQGNEIKQAQISKQITELEKKQKQRNFEIAKAEYELTKKKNELTKSGASDLDKEAQAYAAMQRAAAELQAMSSEEREITRKTSGKVDDSAQKELEAQEKALAELRARMEERNRTELENQLHKLEEEKKKELEVVGLTEEEKASIEAYYAAQSEKLVAENEAKRQEARLKARVQFGIEEGETAEEKELRELADAREADLLNAEEYEMARTAIANKYSEQRQKKQDEELAKANQMYDKNVMDAANATSTALKSVSDMLGEFSEESEEAAKAQKALGMTSIITDEAIMIANTAKGITAAVSGAAEAAAAGGPLAPVLIAAYTAEMVGVVLGAVASTASSITQAKQLMEKDGGKYETGGIVPGTSYTGDKVNIHTNSGEMILTKSQQARLFDIANGGQSGTAYEAMTAAMTSAVASMPAPVMAYSEFNDFTSRVATYNEIAKI